MVWKESSLSLPYLYTTSLNKPSKDSLNIIGGTRAITNFFFASSNYKMTFLGVATGDFE